MVCTRVGLHGEIKTGRIQFRNFTFAFVAFRESRCNGTWLAQRRTKGSRRGCAYRIRIGIGPAIVNPQGLCAAVGRADEPVKTAAAEVLQVGKKGLRIEIYTVEAGRRNRQAIGRQAR